MLSRFDEPFRALDGKLRDASVAFDIAVVRARHQFGRRMRTPEIGDLLRPFIDKQNNHMHLLVIFRDCFSDVMQQCRLASPGRRNN